MFGFDFRQAQVPERPVLSSVERELGQQIRITEGKGLRLQRLRSFPAFLPTVISTAREEDACGKRQSGVTAAAPWNVA